MLKKSKVISANGSSVITVDGKEVTAMTMNASMNEDGAISMNKYIKNKEVYFENQESMDADYEEFETFVKGLAEV